MSEEPRRRVRKRSDGRKKTVEERAAEAAPQVPGLSETPGFAPFEVGGEADDLELEAGLGADTEDEASELWVVFRIAERRYALPVLRIQEVLRAGVVTRVPHAPHAIRGVTNMRGRVLPLVDLRQRLGFEAKAIGSQDRILVTLSAAGPVGLLVDAVEHMVPVRASERSAPPDELGEEELGAALAVADVGDRPMVLLDLERLLAPFAVAARAS
ncbi:MAG: purine-binding chemotaxis protein CheW [Acidobacteria bacterium]|nr:purine-binding chemotaxis protein CheW [Acidobacteriota bacterium]